MILEYQKIKEKLKEFTLSDLGNKMVDKLHPYTDLAAIKNILNIKIWCLLLWVVLVVGFLGFGFWCLGFGVGGMDWGLFFSNLATPNPKLIYPFSFFSSGSMRSIGSGNTMVVFLSLPISFSVCR